LYGREFVLLKWGRGRVGDWAQFLDEQGTVVSLRPQWTTLFSPPPLVALSGGRSVFRADDLVELAELLRGLDSQVGP
jgi:hypothetical protein